MSQVTAATLPAMLSATRNSSLVLRDTRPRSFHPKLVQVPCARGKLLPVVRVSVEPQGLRHVRYRNHSKILQHLALNLIQIFGTAGAEHSETVLDVNPKIDAPRRERDRRLQRSQRQPEQDGISRHGRLPGPGIHVRIAVSPNADSHLPAIYNDPLCHQLGYGIRKI